MKPAPNHSVVQWVDLHQASATYITSVTLAELLYGVGRLPSGRRKTELSDQVEAMVSDDFEHRVLAFDETAATHYADIVVQRERIGRPIGTADAQIAAICRSHGASLGTRNVDDFTDASITIINPWESKA